jgi:hypothetical protein
MAHPLREAVKRRFYPYAESRGFVRARSSHPHFADFRRDRGGKAEVFDVQWDKYGRPAFVVNFGVVEAARTGETAPRWKNLYRLVRDAAARDRWFDLRKPWGEALRSLRLRYRPDAVVDQLIARFPEAEAWWTRGAVGPHVRHLWGPEGP